MLLRTYKVFRDGKQMEIFIATPQPEPVAFHVVVPEAFRLYERSSDVAEEP